MVRRSEAPPPGWYPDPTGRSGLLWWDGADWTTHHRPAPAHHVHPGPGEQAQQPAQQDAEGGARAVPSATQLRSRGTQQRRQAEREIADAAAEARRVAKAEVERAINDATRQFTRTREEWQPRLQQYGRRIKRWARIVVVAVVLFVALSTWASATMQTSLLEWLGERIDAATE